MACLVLGQFVVTSRNYDSYQRLQFLEANKLKIDVGSYTYLRIQETSYAKLHRKINRLGGMK